MSCDTDDFTVVTSQTLCDSLANGLFDTANRARNIASRLGVRPYVVRIIRVGWTGGVRHQGQKTTLGTFTILPTPKVTLLTALRDVLLPIGRDTEGAVVVTQINPSLTEDQLRGAPEGLTEIPANQEVFWEIEYPHERIGSRKRRFHLDTVPAYDAENLQWVVGLVAASPDRTRDGALEAVG